MEDSINRKELVKVIDEFYTSLDRITDKAHAADIAHQLKIPFELALFIQYAIAESFHNGGRRDIEYLAKRYLRRLQSDQPGAGPRLD
ncbi:MAG TPA: hypothetical protein ENK09_06840 [Nitrospirae bacterium]|nr:hypothetical protein [Nitrospirota bacterium]